MSNDFQQAANLWNLFFTPGTKPEDVADLNPLDLAEQLDVVHDDLFERYVECDCLQEYDFFVCDTGLWFLSTYGLARLLIAYAYDQIHS